MSQISTASGLFVLNKPEGLSSRQAACKLVKKFGRRVKFGHVGTLDPAASGVLPVLIGHATKCMDYLHERSKEYSFTLKLGETTDTLDREGQITETADVPTLSSELICDKMKQLQGVIKQIPPLYSAVKKDGQPLYKIARKGREIDLSSLQREVVVEELKLKEWDPEKSEIKASVRCGKGTYVRTLGADLARKLGTVGYLTQLCRESSSGFTLGDAVSLDGDLSDIAVKMVPINRFPFEFPSWKSSSSLIKRLFHGQSVVTSKQLWQSQLVPPQLGNDLNRSFVLVIDDKGDAVGIGRVKELDSQNVQIHMQRGLK